MTMTGGVRGPSGREILGSLARRNMERARATLQGRGIGDLRSVSSCQARDWAWRSRWVKERGVACSCGRGKARGWAEKMHPRGGDRLGM